MQTTMQYLDPASCFQEAIDQSVLSPFDTAHNYAGLYMHMGTVNGLHQFKHSQTRKYITSLTPGFVAPLRAHTNDA